ncbi:MAG TPA: OB-fold domain-containing protein [Candidatus Nitrosotalea sp.]|nr:OB-fold domain-containing protein [Candidatus Saccharimonadales bacterium]HVB78215.1 OB-fold domain-containing protein [Candidatus Nitrosotalea sp.]
MSARPLPVIHPDNQEFWDSLRRHELSLQRCRECSEVRFPVSPVCPRCLSEEFSWEVMSGRGQLVVAVTVHRATGNPWWSERVPFSVALVRLAEGPRIKGGIDNSLASLPPGTPLRVAFDDQEEVTLLHFRSDESGTDARPL